MMSIVSLIERYNCQINWLQTLGLKVLNFALFMSADFRIIKRVRYA